MNEELEVANQYIEKLDKKMLLLRQEVDQYVRDLIMWKTTTGSEYAHRRLSEVQKKIEEINKL